MPFARRPISGVSVSDPLALTETDSFAPVMRQIVVACKGPSRYFDLDVVREPYGELTLQKHGGKTTQNGEKSTRARGMSEAVLTQAGAPPLDYWIVNDDPIDYPEGEPVSQARYIVADVFDGLRTLPDNSVDLVLTSPPFLALRSYLPADHPDKAKEIGSEATPGAFLDVLLDVVVELRRVLAPHGSLCVELGDTYSGASGWQSAGPDLWSGAPDAGVKDWRARPDKPAAGPGWPLAKSLCMVPQSFAWALAYGRNPWTGRELEPWRVRNIVRWCRPNPPVGALGDKFRPATSEMVAACVGGSRYFDLDAVREPSQGQPDKPNGPKGAARPGVIDHDGAARLAYRIDSHPAGAPPLDYWVIPTQPYSGAHYASFPTALCVKPILAMSPSRVCRVCGKPSERITEHSFTLDESRPQARRAMEIAREAGLTEDHFAAIRATGITGSSAKAAVTQKGFVGNTAEVRRLSDEARAVLKGYYAEFIRANPETLGWSDCECAEYMDRYGEGESKWRRGRVLDPFAGSGTTLEVATGHGRDAIGIDLDASNAELARQRVGLFLTVDEFGGERV